MFCSLFDQMDNNYEGGDLTDIVRPSSSSSSSAATSTAGFLSEFSLHPYSGDDRLWPHLPADHSMNNFGDPFLFPTTAQDPFLHPHFSAFNFASDVGGGDGGGLAGEERPCNMFSRMLQISPNSELGDRDGVITSSAPCESPAAVGNSPTQGSGCGGAAVNPLCVMEMENSGIQISSPRNPAIKRRKSQVKKVVCIPAPAPANSRSSSGEVVPSDLWAWRKYGQKPIKGSPYPRGYYRCSSSKGCSARKQVERSRTNPNMLVITYTSEHNHPWPTQRNALAGSTRSHPNSRTTVTATATTRKTSPKHERNNGNLATTAVKEEELDEDLTIEKAAETITRNDHQEEGIIHQEFPYDLIFAEFSDQMNDHHHQYPPAEPLNNNNLLLFSCNGFTTGNDDHERSKDPFLELYDWAENSNASFFKEAKGG